MAGSNLRPVPIKHVAELLGVAYDTAKKRIDKSGFKEAKGSTAQKRLYFIPDILPLFMDLIYEKSTENLEAKERKILAEAILAEMKVAVEQKQLVTITDYFEEHERFVLEIKNNFLNMPKKLAPNLLNKDSVPQITDILETEILEALNCLSNGGE